MEEIGKEGTRGVGRGAPARPSPAEHTSARQAARGPGSADGRGSRLPLEFLPHPPTSLPHRDLLVLEQLPLRPGDRVCEVGVGTGATAARLTRLGASRVVGLDASAAAVRAASYLEGRHKNLAIRAADVTRGEDVEPWAGRFEAVFSCDTLEHVDDPDAFFQGIAALLVPGGRCLITFPNEPPETMHGVTRFDGADELEASARRAGLRAIDLGAARLTPDAAKVAEFLGWRPLAGVRAAMRAWRRARGAGGGGAPAQRFEDTRFFEHYGLWRRLSPAVNLYWYAVLRLMARRGSAYDMDWGFRRTPIDDCQVLLRAEKPA